MAKHLGSTDAWQGVQNECGVLEGRMEPAPGTAGVGGAPRWRPASASALRSLCSPRQPLPSVPASMSLDVRRLGAPCRVNKGGF